MKIKIIAMNVLVLSLLVGMFTITAFAGELNIHINDEKVSFIDAKPYIDEANRTMIPVRMISESLGATVDWVAESQTIKIVDQDKFIELVIGSKDIKVNGEGVKLDTQAVIKESRTFVPIRFVAEALGKEVKWDELTQTVSIIKEDGKPASLIVVDFKETDKLIGGSFYTFSEDIFFAAYVTIQASTDIEDSEQIFIQELKNFLSSNKEQGEIILENHKIEFIRYSDHIGFIVYAATDEVVNADIKQ